MELIIDIYLSFQKFIQKKKASKIVRLLLVFFFFFANCGGSTEKGIS